jgi:TRAP-type C4-dicarboxylate transport system substrate-binding protein
MRFSSSLVAAMVLVFAATAHAQKPAKAPAKAQVEIKFATLAPDGSTWMKTMRKIDEDVRARTENRVGFKFYPGGVQGDEKDVIRKMRNGQIHAAGFTGFGLGAIVPETRVLELPFMFDSIDELDYVRGATNDYYEKAFKAKDYALLGWTDVGFVYLYTKAPVRKVSDMPAVKWWIWSGDLAPDRRRRRRVRLTARVRGTAVVHARQVHGRRSRHAWDQCGGGDREVAGGC